ncbi:hypothetical protein [Xylophilus ampelinus]|uniref:Tail assembly chaperone n=1 Tax=Xylophilus ampelinus TaxID=54067 RepID=A0A318SLT3_9BURK|nr:hypothetical protein [Xylophilus ampelinus]MCS4508889.1 hypothetical protein [Xylophilus ampelinus]PYE79458.1 hypothetical protein DFQ15_102191 [Xylophilus ampelinus]
MAISIVVSETVSFKVKGTINNATGTPEPFDFRLTCERLDQEQINAKQKEDGEQPLADFLVEVTTDWSGVKTQAKENVPFSEDAYRSLLKIPGLAYLTYRTYLAEVGAKEKN